MGDTFLAHNVEILTQKKKSYTKVTTIFNIYDEN